MQGQPSPAPTVGPSVGAPALSPRQSEVFDLIAVGFTDREIGARLGISSRTVRMHVDQLRRKFNVKHRRELLLIYAQLIGIISNHIA